MTVRRPPMGIGGLRLTPSQAAALRCIDANYGEAGEFTVWLEGLNRPRRTLDSLVRRGLLERGEYLNETDGYIYRRIPTGDGSAQ